MQQIVTVGLFVPDPILDLWDVSVFKSAKIPALEELTLWRSEGT